MPDIEMPKRAKGVTQSMRGRADDRRRIGPHDCQGAVKRKREPEKWQRLIARAVALSGLRLSEALALSWDDDAPISVCTTGKYPALRIQAEAQKKHRDELLPIAPEFAEFLLAVPEADRHGLVFGIYGENGQPLSTKRASRYISCHRQGGERRHQQGREQVRDGSRPAAFVLHPMGEAHHAGRPESSWPDMRVSTRR